MVRGAAQVVGRGRGGGGRAGLVLRRPAARQPGRAGATPQAILLGAPAAAGLPEAHAVPLIDPPRRHSREFGVEVLRIKWRPASSAEWRELSAYARWRVGLTLIGGDADTDVWIEQVWAAAHGGGEGDAASRPAVCFRVSRMDMRPWAAATRALPFLLVTRLEPGLALPAADLPGLATQSFCDRIRLAGLRVMRVEHVASGPRSAALRAVAVLGAEAIMDFIGQSDFVIHAGRPTTGDVAVRQCVIVIEEESREVIIYELDVWVLRRLLFLGLVLLFERIALFAHGPHPDVAAAAASCAHVGYVPRSGLDLCERDEASGGRGFAILRFTLGDDGCVCVSVAQGLSAAAFAGRVVALHRSRDGLPMSAEAS